MVPEIIVPAVHHIPSPGASTAREKGSAGPAQERRDSGTLHERHAGVVPSVARRVYTNEVMYFDTVLSLEALPF